jgi:hypothetical protein
MILKSQTEQPVQVALLSGHCMVVGPEGIEIPAMFLSEAFKMGCIPVDVDPEVVKAAPPKPASKEKLELITDGVKKMLEADCVLTGAGMPNRKELSTLVGFPVTAEDLTAAWTILEAETK